jgi:hypothetical protein
VSGAARADAPQPSAPAVADALTDQARELHLKGAALFDKGQYPQAEAAFLAAWAIKKHFQIAANLGACELKLGKSRAAAEHLAYAVRAFVPQDSPERATAAKLLGEARAKVATVTLNVDDVGADVLVDGALVGSTPLADPVFVEAGAHTIELRRDGQVRASAKVDAKEGSEQTITLSAKKSAPGADGPRMGLVVAGGAVALVLAGGGIGIAVAGSDKGNAALRVHDEIVAAGRSCVAGAANYDARCTSVKSESSAADAMNGAGIGLAIGGGVVAAATAAYWIFAPRGEAKASAIVVPVFSPGAGGVVVRGSF